MQLKSLRLGAMVLAGAVLLAAAVPVPHAAAQTSDDAAISSLSEAEQLRIQRAVLDRLWGIREFREREIGDLRSGYTSSAAREYLDSQIAWVEGIEQGDPRIMFETALRLRDGDGLPQHRRAALTWLERAGDLGVPEAHYAAVLILLDEPDNFLNRIMVKDLLKRAARKGVAAAQRDLGMRLIAADPHSGGSYQGYHWLLLAQVNGADVDTGALTEASASLSAEERLAVGLKISLAVGKSVSTNWPHDWDTGE